MSDSERQILVALRHLAQCLEQREKASRVGHTTCVLWVGEVDIAARELQKAIDAKLSIEPELTWGQEGKPDWLKEIR
jgi:hypothetical protein